MKKPTKPAPYTELDQTLFMHDPLIIPVKPKPRRPLENMVVAASSS